MLRLNKTFLIAAALSCAMASGPGSAEAQDWREGAYPYAKKYHRVCLKKAIRLWKIERAVTADHKLSAGELLLVAALKKDLDKTCGRYRYRQ